MGAMRVRSGIAGRIALDELAKPGLGKVAKHREGAVGGAVGGDRRRLRPIAVDVAEEVVARLHRPVHARSVDAPAAIALRLDRRRSAGAALLRELVEDGDHRAHLVEARMALARPGGRGGGEREQRGGQDKALLHRGVSPQMLETRALLLEGSRRPPR
jgi:ribosomal protein S25